MVTRRTLLRRVSGLLAVGSAGAMAGCPGSSGSSDTSPAGDGPPKPGAGPGYASGMYDPSSVLDASTHGFVSYDLGTLYEHRDLFPSETVSQIEQYDQRYDAVSLADLGRLTGQAYTSASVADLQNMSGGQTPPAGGTVLVDGSFKSDRIVEMLRQSDSQATVEKVGSTGGYTLYTVQSQSSVPATLALSDGSVGMGAVSRSADAAGESAVETMIGAQGGGSEYYAAGGPIKRLMDALGDGTTVTGIAGNFDPLTQNADFPTENVKTVLRGIRALGSRATLDSDTLANSIAAVYTDGKAPSQATVEKARDWLQEQLRQTDSSPVPLEDITVAVDGDVVTASLSRDPEKVISRATDATALGGPELLLLMLFPAAAPFFLALDPA